MPNNPQGSTLGFQSPQLVGAAVTHDVMFFAADLGGDNQ
jgi:hypothetical protein